MKSECLEGKDSLVAIFNLATPYSKRIQYGCSCPMGEQIATSTSIVARDRAFQSATSGIARSDSTPNSTLLPRSSSTFTCQPSPWRMTCRSNSCH